MLKTKTSLVKSATVSLTETVGPLCTEKKKNFKTFFESFLKLKKLWSKMKFKYFTLANSIERLTLTILRRYPVENRAIPVLSGQKSCTRVMSSILNSFCIF